MSSIQAVQAFWNKRPCNSKHSLKTPNSLEYFQEVRQRRYFVEPHIWTFLKPYNYKGKKVLDAGCGIGTDALSFALRGAYVTGIDLSEKSIAIVRKGAKKFGVKLKLYNANLEKLSKTVPVKKYDLIYSFGVIHHTPSPQKALEELKKYADKDTIFKFMFYNKYSWKSFVLWLKDRSFKNSEAQQNSPVTYVYSKQEIKKLLKDFEILKMKVDFIFPYKVDKYIRYKYEKVWYYPVLNLLKRWLGWHILIEARLK